MLPTYVQLHDIEDAEGFVAATLKRSGIKLDGPDEHEELMAEGLCILHELAGKYEPHRAGYEQGGSFSGYAAQFLPRRLGDAWHRSHPEHHRIAGEDGKRKWHYEDATLSLDSLLAETPPTADGAGKSFGFESSIRPLSHWAQAPARVPGPGD